MNNFVKTLLGAAYFFLLVAIFSFVAGFTWDLMEAGWDLGSSILN